VKVDRNMSRIVLKFAIDVFFDRHKEGGRKQQRVNGKKWRKRRNERR
jgi:hypothetical protein